MKCINPFSVNFSNDLGVFLKKSEKCAGSGSQTHVSNIAECGYECAKLEASHLHYKHSDFRNCECFETCYLDSELEENVEHYELVTGMTVFPYTIYISFLYVLESANDNFRNVDHLHYQKIGCNIPIDEI